MDPQVIKTEFSRGWDAGYKWEQERPYGAEASNYEKEPEAYRLGWDAGVSTATHFINIGLIKRVHLSWAFKAE